MQKFDLFNAPIAEHTRDADGLPRHNMIGAARSRMLHEVESGIAVVSDGVMSIGAFVGSLVGWLVGWLAGWLVGWLVDCLVGGMVG